jgi:hypothetical protein
MRGVGKGEEEAYEESDVEAVVDVEMEFGG